MDSRFREPHGPGPCTETNSAPVQSPFQDQKVVVVDVPTGRHGKVPVGRCTLTGSISPLGSSPICFALKIVYVSIFKPLA